jgi:hypothetical protein
VLQFDTRSRSLFRRLVFALPDPLLPRLWRRYIRRYPLGQGVPSAMAREAGLEVVKEAGPGTELHFVLVRK